MISAALGISNSEPQGVRSNSLGNHNVYRSVKILQVNYIVSNIVSKIIPGKSFSQMYEIDG